jgi:chromosome segregation ATPase
MTQTLLDVTPLFDHEKSGPVKIRRIIIQNFLTFESDSVEFDPEITIITGPNGAGKSTVYQALKFVLGSNVYDGRYSKWSDFIRTGADKAQVQVDIEVDGQLFGIQRIVFRDKAPSFWMKNPNENKFHNVTVNDIKDFIAKAQIDPDNLFSFMAQGNIDSIKDFKEQTLCAFVEKGIGLHEKRIEITRLKEKIEQLDREYQALLNKFSNYQFQLRDLKPKLERLEQKHKYIKQLEELNLELAWAQREEIRKEIANAQQKLQLIQNEIATLSEHRRQIQSIISNLESSIQETQEQLTGITTEYATYDARAKELQEKISHCTDEKTLLLNRMDELKKKIEAISQNILKNNSEINGIEQKAQKNDESLKLAEDLINKLIEEERMINTELQQHNAKWSEFQNKQNEKAIRSESLGKLENRHKDIENQIKGKLQEHDAIHNELCLYKWFLEDKQTDPLKRYQEFQSRYTSQITEIEDKIHLADLEHKDIQRKLKELDESDLSKERPKPEPIRLIEAEIQTRQLPAYGPIIEFLDYDEMYQAAIESIFGEYVLYSFVTDDRDTFYLLKELITQTHAKCNIYLTRRKEIEKQEPIESSWVNKGIFGYMIHLIDIVPFRPEIQKLVYSIAADTIIVKDQVVATESLSTAFNRERLVTLDGEQFKNKKYVMEARVQNQKKKLMSRTQRRKERTELEEIADNNRKMVAQLNKDREIAVKRLQKAEERLRQIPELLHKMKKQEILTKMKDNLLNQREELYHEINDNKKIISDLEVTIEKIRTDLPPNLGEREARLKIIPDEIAAQRLELQKLQKNKEKWQTEIADYRTKNATALAEKSFAEQEISSIDNNLKQTDVEFYRIFQELTLVKESLAELAQQKSELSNAIKEVRNQILEQNTELRAIEEQIFDLEKDAQHFTSEIAEKENNLHQVEDRIRLRPDLLKQPRPIPEIRNELVFVENMIRNYCDVNDTLLDEKAELESSIVRIQEKQQEVADEIKKVTTAEQEAEKKYHSLYLKSIKKLETMMNVLFTKSNLPAHVNLVLEGDFENLGLRIDCIFAAQCSYKLSALSGGQRSMVGICLMLSLHNLNPSPFNIYDEIQMFLDPKNAHIVSRMIFTLSKNGLQFVILMPDASKTLLDLARKVVGISRNGDSGPAIVLDGTM